MSFLNIKENSPFSNVLQIFSYLPFVFRNGTLCTAKYYMFYVFKLILPFSLNLLFFVPSILQDDFLNPLYALPIHLLLG